ncbi:two-component system osmolarity sensor histidine kinase EnvZ [Sphingomonas sp. UYAg733]
MRRVRGSLGLLGRIFAILLLTVVVEFGASTMLYERAGSFSVREDEARRLAEHLVITRKLLAEREASARPAMANELTTDRYSIHWAKGLPAPPPLTGDLVEMRGQIVTWEPGLAQSDLRLGLAGARRGSIVTGGLKLPDGSWVYFSARGIVREWTLALGHIALALIPALALLIVGGLLIRRTLQPIQRLAEATAHLGSGTYVAIAESGTVEVRNLIHAFNEMQLRIHRLITDRTQALAAVGHDIRTPLSRIQLRLDGVAEPLVRDAIGADVAEMNAMVASLLAFLNGEDDPEQPAMIDIAVLATTIVDEVSDRGETASYTGPEHLEVKLRQIAIRRALSNLVENAIHYGGAAHVSIEKKADRIMLAVEDDGPGIPEDRLDDVLTPFMRLDDARARNTQGLGLGLAIVALAVEREGGMVNLSNRPIGGLRAEISLPKA